MNPHTLPPTQDFRPADLGAPAPDTQVENQTTPDAGDGSNRTLAYAAAGAAPPPQVPGFAIEAELGRGGMGVVYRARQLGLDRTVALKMILKADFASPEQKLRFQIEAENAARVQHPNIVQVFEIGAHQGQPYFALEFIDGGSLADWLTSHRPAPAAAAALIETLARAVHAAHLQGIVHRDLKPANILLASPECEFGEFSPKIADFGLAKRLDSTHDLTGSGAVMGTPSHMAPEQARGDTKHVGPAADQYALGVIFYQLLTGRLPFEAISVPTLLKKITEEEPAPPRGRNANVPLDLQVICLKALEKEPAKRYPSAEALADDLRAWRERRPIAARPATRVERVTKWCRRYPAVAALIVVSVLAALIASGLAWWAVGAERAAVRANDLTAQRLEQIEKINNSVFDIFTGFDIRKVKAGPDPVEYVLADQLIQAGRKLDAKAINDPLVLASLRSRLGSTLMSLGRYQEAIEFLSWARETTQTLLGADHPDTLSCMNNLAAGYHAARKLDQALPLYEETLKRRRAKLGADHPDTLSCMNNLAAGYHAARKLDHALPLYEETLKRRRAKLGADHPGTLTSMSNLAEIYLAVGKIDLALPLQEESLKLAKVKLGADHLDTLDSMNNLAGGYHAAGKLDQAVPLYEETLKLRKAKLGAEHPRTLQSMSNLAGGYHAAGKLDQAVPLYEETLKLRKARLGADHPDTLRSMGDLAGGYHAAGKFDLAVPLLEETLKLMKAKLGADHPDTLTCMNNLAGCLQDAGKLDQAFPLFEETLKLMKAKLGADHPDTLTCMNNLAGCYQDAGMLDQALPLHEETLSLTKAKLGADHPDTLGSMSNLAACYKDAGKLGQALPLFEEAAQGVERRRFQHEHVSRIIPNTIRAYEEARQLDQAEAWRRKWLAHVKATAGADSPAYAVELVWQSASLFQQQKWVEAESALRECLAIREKKEPQAGTTFNTMSMLGWALLGQKKYTEAEPLLVKGYEGLKQRAATMPPLARPRLLDAGERLAELYEATHRSAEAAKLRAELLPLRVPPKPPGR